MLIDNGVVFLVEVDLRHEMVLHALLDQMHILIHKLRFPQPLIEEYIYINSLILRENIPLERFITEQ